MQMDRQIGMGYIILQYGSMLSEGAVKSSSLEILEERWSHLLRKFYLYLISKVGSTLISVMKDMNTLSNLVTLWLVFTSFHTLLYFSYVFIILNNILVYMSIGNDRTIKKIKQ